MDHTIESFTEIDVCSLQSYVYLVLMINHLHTQLAGYRLTAERRNHAVVLKLDYFVTGSAASDWHVVAVK